MSAMDIDNSYLTASIHRAIEMRLKQLRAYAEEQRSLSGVHLCNISLETLNSLNRKSLPIPDLYNFRKVIVIEFNRRHQCDIDPTLPLSLELQKACMDPSFQMDTLIVEYHKRLWGCLLFVLGFIVPVVTKQLQSSS